MRRALVFLTLFALGLTLLLVLRGRKSAPDEGPDVGAPAPQGQFTEVTLPGKEGEQGRAIGVVLDGPLALTLRGGAGPVLKPEIELRAADVDSLGGERYDLNDLEVELLDPDRGTRRAEVRSPKARVELVLGTTTPDRSALRTARFHDAELVLLEGAPIVPLTFRAPTLDWDVERFGFTSTDRVTVTGQGLDARGDGLRAGFGQEELHLERAADVRLQLEGGDVVELASGETGALVVRRIERDGVAYVDVTAHDDARLSVEGREPMTIRGRTIHLVGRLPEQGSEAYEIVSADAQGDVVATSRGDEFRAQTADFAFAPGGRLQLGTLDGAVVLRREGNEFRSGSATFEFDERGGLSRATLVGEPEGDLGVGEFLRERRPEAAGARAHLRGAGPLVVELRDGTTLDLVGPARADMDDIGLVLDARERLRGRVDQARREGELHATGDVGLDYAGSRLEGPQVDLSWRLGADDALAVDAASPGATTLRSRTKEGHAVELVAQSGLMARYERERLLVPEAQGVSLTIAGDRPITARARTVRGLDWEARTFTAEGDVHVTGPDGEGAAERAQVFGERDVELFGTPSALASFDFARAGAEPARDLQARVDALHIHVTERRAVADGDVRLHGALADSALDLRAGRVEVDVAPERPGSAEPRPFRVHAEEAVRAHGVRLPDVADLDADWLHIEGRLEPDPAHEPPVRAVARSVEARGAVHLVMEGRGALDASADRLFVDESGRAQLSAGSGRRVLAVGRLPGALSTYRLAADWIDFDAGKIRASRFEADLVEEDTAAAQASILRQLRARSLTADEGSILLEGEARVAGATGQDEPWSIDAASLRLQGDFRDPGVVRLDDVRTLLAQGGFVARMGSRGVARGERLEGEPGTIRIEGRPAQLEVMDAQWRSPWIRYDMANMLLATGAGEVTSLPTAPGGSWSLEYESMQPFDQGDRTILALRNPRMRLSGSQLFAEWMLLWIDREKWRRSGRRTLSHSVHGAELRVTDPLALAQTPSQAGRPLGFLDRFIGPLRGSAFFGLLSELYLEGNLEVYDIGERRGRAAALYLDLVDEHGWIQDADIQVALNISGLPRTVRAKTDWLRVSSDGTLRADTAVLTACEFDEPHYVVETRDLRLSPEANPEDERVKFRASAEGNAIRFGGDSGGGGLVLPLPPLIYETNEEGKPLLDRFVLGNSAKYGAAIGASINAQLGVVGQAVGKFTRFALQMPDVPIRGGWNFDVRYLGLRGLLLGAGMDLRVGDAFKLNADLDVIPDDGEDKGLVRVDKDDRSLLRTWFHARGRYTLERGDDAEWVDLALSLQSDPGVQAEFFERDYLRYEEKDNYLHWRKARGTDYYSATAKVVLDDRTDVAELPSVGLFRGRKPIGELFGQTLYHTGSLDAAYLQRKQGDPRYYPQYPDGLGDQETLRADLVQRVELPFAVGALEAIATPYVEARGTAWSDGVEDGDTPAQAALLVGAEASTTFWRRSSGGPIHTLTPTIGVHGDVADVEGGGTPVRYDATEDPFLGKFVDFGLRARWWKPEAKDRLDVEVRTAIADGLEAPREDGLQPFATLAQYYTFLGGFPFGVTYDSRYDARENETVYSSVQVGFEPVRNVGFQLGHHYGRDAARDVLYEAASAGLRWRWTTKWEIEADQTFSLRDNDPLGTDVVVRRLGHDVVFELEVGYRAGEGSRLGFGFEPRLSWSRTSLGLIDNWLGVYH